MQLVVNKCEAPVNLKFGIASHLKEPSGFCLYGYVTALMVLAWHRLPDKARRVKVVQYGFFPVQAFCKLKSSGELQERPLSLFEVSDALGYVYIAKHLLGLGVLWCALFSLTLGFATDDGRTLPLL